MAQQASTWALGFSFRPSPATAHHFPGWTLGHLQGPRLSLGQHNTQKPSSVPRTAEGLEGMRWGGRTWFCRAPGGLGESNMVGSYIITCI